MKLSKIVLGFILFQVLGGIVMSSCSYEPEISEGPVNLTFSTDTIQFDTIFAERKSITRRLIVKNPSNQAISIEDISLVEGVNDFNLILNGREGKSFSNQQLLGNDSLLLLIEATIDQTDENNPFVIRDAIQFSNKSNLQSVIVEAYGQNANYLRDSVVTCNTTWTANRPYVLSNNILIDSACTLIIEAGTKIYSANNSFILIDGTLIAEGTLEQPIIFSNDRLDEPFASTPGQWGGIVFLSNSKDNLLNYVDVKNGIVGLNLNVFDQDGLADVSVQNSRVGNMSFSAVLSLNSDFSAVNSIFYQTISSTVSHLGGGTASYLHCTIANYFNVGREQPAAFFSDYAIDNNENQILNPLNVALTNTIVYGRINDEIGFFEQQEGNLSLSFSNSLFRTSLQFLNQNNSIINEDPLFNQVNDFDFRLLGSSPAIAKASPSNVSFDIAGNPRGGTPAIGAYEYAEPKEDSIN
jgi:hypothetical protein